MDQEQAEKLMAEGRISNFAMVDDKAEIKASMEDPIESSWPVEDQRSK